MIQFIKINLILWRFFLFSSLTTALGEFLSPEEIKRGGTGSATNKAFERYFQPRRMESVKVVSTIKKMQKKQAGKVIKMLK